MSGDRVVMFMFMLPAYKLLWCVLGAEGESLKVYPRFMFGDAGPSAYKPEVTVICRSRGERGFLGLCLYPSTYKLVGDSFGGNLWGGGVYTLMLVVQVNV